MAKGNGQERGRVFMRKPKFNLIVGALLLGVMLSSLAGNAQQLPPPPPTPCSTGGECGPSGGGASGGNYGGSIGEIIGLPGAIIRAHKNAKSTKATALNDQGVSAYDRKDWAAAEVEFKKALKLNPNDRVFLRNLAMTQGLEGEDAYRRGDYSAAINYFQQALANDPTDDPDKHTLNDDLAAVQGKINDAQREQEQRRQDKITANNMQHGIQDLAQSLSAAPSSGGLEFSDGKSATPAADDNSGNKGGLDFMSDSTPSQSTPDSHSDHRVAPGPMGSKVARPDLQTVGPAHMGTDTKAGDQLLSVDATGNSHGDMTMNYDVGGA
jgi:hypothetical protein